MPKPVIVTVPHELGREEAHRRLAAGFGRIREQIVGKALAVDERWEGERLHFSASGLGQAVSGRVDVFEEHVRIELDLPWFLAAIAEKLQGRIRRESTLLLGKK